MNAQLQTNESPISLGHWILTLIVLAIPLVNIIMLFVWGFSAGTPPSKQNFCRAYLIMLAVGFVLGLLFIFTVGMSALQATHALGGATL